jgi:putative ABC transport system ATP-binding protein
VLVTHEHDIAAFASRLIGFRDGHVVNDHFNSRPADARSRLSELERSGELTVAT